MLNITDKSYVPTLAEMEAYIQNPLFEALVRHLETAYKARYEIMYSGDTVLLGWNVRFYKAGRTLCRLYPRVGSFGLLVVVGRKEKERVEAALPQLSPQLREIYAATKEGMGQRWLIFDLQAPDALFEDVKALIQIRRETK